MLNVKQKVKVMRNSVLGSRKENISTSNKDLGVLPVGVYDGVDVHRWFDGSEVICKTIMCTLSKDGRYVKSFRSAYGYCEFGSESAESAESASKNKNAFSRSREEAIEIVMQKKKDYEKWYWAIEKYCDDEKAEKADCREDSEGENEGENEE